MNSLLHYFSGAVHEFKNITWPTEAETFRIAKITVVFIAFFTVLFFVTDWLFSTALGSFFTLLEA